MFTFIAVFFAFLATVGSASFANAQEYPNTLRLTRADGMQIELKNKTTNGAGTAFYLYNEIGYGNPNTKLQNMYAASVILGLGSASNITDDNRSRIMNEPSTGRNYIVSLPTLGEIRNLRNVHGGRPRQWRGNLDNHYEFLTSSKTSNALYKVFDIDNGQDNNRWDWEMRVLALTVTETVSDNRVCFYEHNNFNGKSKCFSNGNYTDLGNYPSEGGPVARTTSSAKAGANCASAVLRGANGQSATVSATNSHLYDLFYENMSDQGVSAEVSCAEDSVVRDPYSVCFFEHSNYQGRSKCYTHGNYPSVGFYADGTNANDTFSSFAIGAGCQGYTQIIFYADNNYTGATFVVVPGSAAVTDPIRRKPWLGETWNDRFSSIEFYCPRP